MIQKVTFKKARKTKPEWGLINVDRSHTKLKYITAKNSNYCSEELTDLTDEERKRTLIFPRDGI